ncbi:non-ribosomal peptide synthetase [Clostridium butanoliproducens]|uniref:non-ribosomal peptide synthetase n=1 Tax=Clostridium butanoliproducens TaxID=2991837 RepID=UPI0024BA3953|nr:non-ribosomal peptide synthetase [Clostridium butanoliproducens]
MNELLKRISKLPPEKLKLLEKRIKENNIDINKNILDIKKNKFESIETVEDKEYYSLSSAQKRMYILNQIENVGVSYNIPMIMIIEGNLNINQFEKTISELVRRHESFRTAFQVVDGEPVQKIFKDIDVKITYSKAREDEIKSKIEEFVEPFDLSKAPLLRVELIKLSMNKHLFMMDTHHIVSDGVSMRIFIKDFINLYKGKELQELSIQYKDFSQWQNNILKTESIEKQREYWLGKFNDEIPVLNMPTDYVRPAVRSFEGDVVKFQIEKELVEDINKLASETGTTLYMVLLGAYNVLLSKYTGQEDIVVGTPVAGRTHSDLDNIIGMFVNTVAMRNYPKGEKSFREFLEEVKETSLEAYENQDYQFEELISQLNIIREPSRNPLFDVMFTLQNFDTENIEVDGLKFRPYEFENKVSKFDMTLSASESKEKITFHLQYSTKLFRRETIERLSKHYINILKEVTNNGEIKLSEIEILSKEEKDKLLYDFNNNKVKYPEDKTLHELFEEQVKRTPNNIAVIYKDEELTYDELNMKANKLAKILRKKGVKADSIVGIMMERSLEMIVGILGILKAGGAYLPIDPDYPKERVEYILKDSRSKLLLTREKSSSNIEFLGETIDLLDEELYEGERNNLERINNSKNLAYVIYTSGSTGKPKGVMVEHKSVINTLICMEKKYPLAHEDTHLLKTKFTFDVSVSELFGWFVGSGKLVIMGNKEEKDINATINLIEKYKVTHINFVPAMLNMFIETIGDDLDKISSLKYVFAAGEELKTDVVSNFYSKFNNIRLENLYGPTETTIYSSRYSVDKNLKYTSIPIGTPIENTQIYIMNNNQLAPIGVPGELCISGDGLARGYLNKPELTAEKFIENPYKLGERMYKTGDLARWLPEGNIEFLGRIDHQVKIRGFRIELGEIEAQLLKKEEIKESVVMAREDEYGNKYICAYVVGTTNFTVKELREYLLKELPEYMIPSYFIQLEAMPLTPNGKIDRKKLPKPEGTMDIGIEYEEARNEIEEKLVEIWKDILNVNQVGINDNFFELGGHSLKAMSLVNKICKELNIEISLGQIFKNSTIKTLGEFIRNLNKSVHSTIEIVEEKEYYQVSSAQKRMYILNQIENVGISYNMPMMMTIKGELNINQFKKTMEELIRRHESFRTAFELIESNPVQKIYKDVTFEIAYSELGEGEIKDKIEKFIQPFELSKAPLLRVELIRLSENNHLFMMDTHHIISDGISTGIFIKEFIALYENKKLPKLKIQYKDFSQWQNNILKTEPIEKQKEYWLGKFNDEIPVLNMPTDYIRPAVRSFEGDVVKFQIEKELVEDINKLASETGTTLYMVLLGAYNVLLSKYTGQEDIVVGTPVSGRTHSDLDNIIGMFVNTIAMRNYPKGEKSFRKFLEEVKETSLEAYENQDYQFEELISQLDIARDFSKNPLFDVMFTFQNIDIENIEIEGLKFRPYEFENKISKFDMTLSAIESKEKITFNLEYCTKLFKRETVERLSKHYVNILKAVVNNVEIKLSEIDIISKEEKNQLLYDFNSGKVEYPKNKTIHELFEEQVKRTPNNIAVVCENNKLTYSELNAKANKLARVLRENGVETNSIVGIMIERSLEMIVGMIGVLKAGGAYLPIEPEYPKDRIKYMIEDSKMDILLTRHKLLEEINYSGKVLDIDDKKIDLQSEENLEKVNTSKDLAYIIYTSGSTGKPKGVLIEHQSVVNMLQWRIKEYKLDSRDSVLQLFSCAFDGFVISFYTPIISGAKVVILNDIEAKDVFVIKNKILSHSITHFITVPSMCLAIMEYLTPEEGKSLRIVTLAGETLTCNVVEKCKNINQEIEVVNEYGPTENSVITTIMRDVDINKKITIGRPIDNTRIFILDKNNKLQPIGVSGELCISGEGLARGYLNKPELTKEKFILNPFEPNTRMYKTGDLARWLPDGNIEFLGRIDNQVKIRGFRIELGEIESQLLRNEKVKETAVISREDKNNNKYICAYIVGDNEINVKELREYLSKELPDYMIPAYFIQLEKIPVTPNGKVDRKVLEQYDKFIDISTVYEAPRNFIEAKMVSVWREILGIEKIGVKDDFFDLGGDSIKAIRIVSKLIVDFEIKINDIFECKTICKLAKKVSFKRDNLKMKIDSFKEIAVTFENSEDNSIFDKKLNNSIMNYRQLNKVHEQIHVVKRRKYKNIFLTGATGYLGMHILHELLNNDDATIYLLIRGKNKKEAEEKLKENFELYFGSNIYESYSDRIFIINGDITKYNFGLEKELYEFLAKTIDCIINSAANVKHYGHYEDFYDVNVKAVERLIEFAKLGKKKDLNHISTISVGAGKANKEDILFSEYNDELESHIDNYYIRTKIEGERIALKAREDGINTNIFRVGNIVFNSRTGVFQKNIDENAFYSQLKSYINLRAMPKINLSYDFSFVDYVSRAIILLYNRADLKNEIYHIFNPNSVTPALVGDLLNKLGFPIEMKSFEDFLEYIYDNYNKEELREHIDNFLVHSNILNNEENKAFVSVCEKTQILLKQADFMWPRLDLEYMNKMVGYCRKVNFLES